MSSLLVAIQTLFPSSKENAPHKAGQFDFGGPGRNRPEPRMSGSITRLSL